MTAKELNTSVARPKAADEVSATDLDEPTKAEILADVKVGLQQSLAGEADQ